MTGLKIKEDWVVASAVLVRNVRKPERIPEGYTRIYVARRTTYRPEYGLDFSVLGNPYTVRSHSREDAIEMYRAWLTPRLGENTPEGRAVELLRERLRAGEKLVLLCWCWPQNCHASVIKDALEGRLS